MTVKVCTIRHTEFRIHPLLIVVLAGACVLGRLYDLLQAMLALTLHETAHVITASAFGCRTRTVELHPFGGVARIEDPGLSPHTRWCIAAAGPVTSFITAGVAAAVCYASPMLGARLQPFMAFNLTLGVVNLIPALPLDGGRIAESLLSKKLQDRSAHQITAWTGVVVGVCMLLSTVAAAVYGVYNLTLPVMGMFLLLSAIGELRTTREKRMLALWQKHDELRGGGGLDVHQFAAHTSMRGSEALRLMRDNRFNLIRVVDGELRLVGELDEGTLLLGMVRLGSDASIGKILSFDRRERLC